MLQYHTTALIQTTAVLCSISMYYCIFSKRTKLALSVYKTKLHHYVKVKLIALLKLLFVLSKRLSIIHYFTDNSSHNIKTKTPTVTNDNKATTNHKSNTKPTTKKSHYLIQTKAKYNLFSKLHAIAACVFNPIIIENIDELTLKSAIDSINSFHGITNHAIALIRQLKITIKSIRYEENKLYITKNDDVTDAYNNIIHAMRNIDKTNTNEISKHIKDLGKNLKNYFTTLDNYSKRYKEDDLLNKSDKNQQTSDYIQSIKDLDYTKHIRAKVEGIFNLVNYQTTESITTQDHIFNHKSSINIDDNILIEYKKTKKRGKKTPHYVQSHAVQPISTEFLKLYNDKITNNSMYDRLTNQFILMPSLASIIEENDTDIENEEKENTNTSNLITTLISSARGYITSSNTKIDDTQAIEATKTITSTKNTEYSKVLLKQISYYCLSTLRNQHQLKQEGVVKSALIPFKVLEGIYTSLRQKTQIMVLNKTTPIPKFDEKHPHTLAAECITHDSAVIQGTAFRNEHTKEEILTYQKQSFRIERDRSDKITKLEKIAKNSKK